MGSSIVHELRSLEVRTDVAYHGDEARLFNSTMQVAADEIERLRLTDAERRVIESLLIDPDSAPADSAATLRGLLERLRQQ